MEWITVSALELNPTRRGAPGDLRCISESTFPVALVHVVGWLDIASSVRLRETVHKTLAQQPHGIVLDVSALRVGEEIALTVFGALQRTAQHWPGCPIALAAPSPELARALDRLGITRSVQLYPTIAQATGAVADAPASRRYEVPLALAPSAAATSRGVVAEACAAWHVEALLDDARIVVTELVTNAVRHGGGEVTLRVSLGPRFLHLSVRDGNPTRPVRSVPEVEPGLGGRGLILIDAMATAWGTIPTGDGQVVWATLRLPR